MPSITPIKLLAPKIIHNSLTLTIRNRQIPITPGKPNANNSLLIPIFINNFPLACIIFLDGIHKPRLSTNNKHHSLLVIGNASIYLLFVI